MPITLGTTGMDSATESEVRAAFNTANAETGSRWDLVNGDDADYIVVDMDSLYGPMSWLRLHAAGKKVIGITSVERAQTDYRLTRPINATDFSVLLSEIAGDTPVQAPPVASTPAPSPVDELPTATAVVDEVEAAPIETPAMAAAPAVVEPEPELVEPEPEPEPEPVIELAPDRPLASWLGQGLAGRVRLKRGDAPALLIDPNGKVYHGPATLKPLAAHFDGTLLAEDFESVDGTTWQSEAASLGAAQPLARLQWLGGLLGGGGRLLPGNDPEGKYRLVKWPQTEREYPKHFRIATAMMKGPATVAEVAEASGVSAEEVADFVNANLITGFAEFVPPAAPEPDEPAPKPSGLFGRMRGR